MEDLKYLQELYKRTSKHANYQILSTRLSQLVDGKNLDIHSRYEAERLDYILKNVAVDDKNALDIGGNSGYFSFELLDKGAKNIHYYEGNRDHAEFVKIAASFLGVTDRVFVTNRYFAFDEMDDVKGNYDLVLLLNVLHHIGDDFGERTLTLDNAKKRIIEQLNSLTDITSLVVFQLGFNWKGNRDMGLFENGTKEEMIRFVTEGIRGYWKVVKIGIARQINGIIVYEDLNDWNIQREDCLGEFLNRPLFILEKQ